MIIFLVSEPLDEDEAEKQRRTIVAKYDRVSLNYLYVIHLSFMLVIFVACSVIF